jgi:hypothetical protein
MQSPDTLPMLEIEDILVTRTHLGREVRVCVPGTPEWFGTIDSWDAERIHVRISPAAVEEHQPEHLRWSV